MTDDQVLVNNLVGEDQQYDDQSSCIPNCIFSSFTMWNNALPPFCLNFWHKQPCILRWTTWRQRKQRLNRDIGDSGTQGTRLAVLGVHTRAQGYRDCYRWSWILQRLFCQDKLKCNHEALINLILADEKNYALDMPNGSSPVEAHTHNEVSARFTPGPHMIPNPSQIVPLVD